MYTSNKYFKSKFTVFTFLLSALIIVLAVILLSGAVRASSIIGVTSNIADVPDGASLVLTITTQNDGDIHELEVDHNLTGLMLGGQPIPEFSVYADEGDPYGGDGALFSAAGTVVTYSAANNQWVIDLGDAVTQVIKDSGVDARFHFVLRDAAGNNLWGSMSPTSAENTFTFNLLEGTGSSLTPEVIDSEGEDGAEDEVGIVIPGVPNTSVVITN